MPSESADTLLLLDPALLLEKSFHIFRQILWD